MSILWQDLRYGLRVLAKSPGFTLTALMTLALGIGATTAVFSVVNTILLKPLPYREAERIVIPWRQAPAELNLGFTEIPWGERAFQIFAREAKSYESLGAFLSRSFNLTGSGEPALIDGLRTSAGFFQTLGVSPALGRTFTSEEDQPGHEHEVVLSHQLWRERFGGDPEVLGRTMNLNGLTYTIIGVMPAGFAFPRAEEMPGSFIFPRVAQLWTPLALPPTPRGPDELAIIGRLKPGVTIDQSQAEMDLFTRRLDNEFPQVKGFFNCRVKPLALQVIGDTRRPLLLILGAVGIVLLIASVNVASLLLTRSLGRSREFSLRMALGAGRWRLARQVLTESLLLAAVGGTLGIFLGESGIVFARRLGPPGIPRLQEVTLDIRVLVFAVMVALITGILFGLAPALGASRDNLVEALKEGGQKSGAGRSNPRVRNALLVSEVALALVLVIAAGLVARSFFRLLGADGGFNAARVLTFELSLPNTKYPTRDSMTSLYKRMLQRLQSLPGIEAAGLGETIPLGGAGESTVFSILERPKAGDKEMPLANYTIASPGYFSALGTPLLRGRDFLETDTIDAPLVTIINNSMARRFWPGENPIGKQLSLPDPRYPAITIVGIVPDVKHVTLREAPAPEMYVPYTQKPWPSMAIMQFAVRTKSDPGALTASMREAIRSIDPDLPLAKLTTLNTLVNDSMIQPRFSMLLIGSFALLALLLAAIGMYGVISYSVLQRTREIGIRMALGAERRNVLALVLGQGARLAGAGIVIGLVAALGVTRLMVSLLYGVTATDPVTYVSVAGLLLVVALLACYLPARRALRVDPMVALRYE